MTRLPRPILPALLAALAAACTSRPAAFDGGELAPGVRAPEESTFLWTDAPGVARPAAMPLAAPGAPSPLRAGAVMEGPELAALVAARPDASRDPTAEPFDVRVCFPGPADVSLAHFRVQAEFLPDVLRYRVFRAPIHVAGETLLFEGDLPYREGAARRYESPIAVELLPGLYRFDLALLRVPLSSGGYTIALRTTLLCEGTTAEREAARIALRESGAAFELDVLERAIAALNADLRFRTALHDVIRVYQNVSLLLSAVSVGVSLANPFPAVLVAIAKEMLSGAVETVVIGVIAEAAPDPSGLRAEDLEFRSIAVRCVYCEHTFTSESIRSGDTLQCPHCGTGIQIAFRVAPRGR